MSLISEKSVAKDQVLRRNMEMYKRLFINIIENVSTLDKVRGCLPRQRNITMCCCDDEALLTPICLMLRLARSILILWVLISQMKYKTSVLVGTATPR